MYTNIKKKNAEKAARRRFEAREFLIILKNSKCVDCGEKYQHYMMDFVRNNGEGKPISKLLLKSKSSILKETLRCDLLCALCSRKRIWEKQRKTRMGPT